MELWIIVFLFLLCLASRAQLSGKRNTLHELKKKRGSFLQEEFPHPLHDRRSGGGRSSSSLEARVDTTMHQLELSRKRTEQYRTSMAVTEQRTAELIVQREKLKKEHSKGLKKGKTAGEKE